MTFSFGVGKKDMAPDLVEEIEERTELITVSIGLEEV